MRLRCLISPNRHIVAGRRYEIAEILEHPGHVMVQKPNGRWPIPGEPYFAMHPDEYFESPKRSIPAVSCGYDYVELEFFGSIIPNSLFPTPQKGQFPNFSPQQEHVSRIVDSVDIKSLWWLMYHDVLLRICFPDTLERRFLLLGIDHQNLGRQTSYRSARLAIKAVMRKLRIPSNSMPPVEDQEIEFWTRSWRKAGLLTWKSPVLSKAVRSKTIQLRTR